MTPRSGDRATFPGGILEVVSVERQGVYALVVARVLDPDGAETGRPVEHLTPERWANLTRRKA